MSKVAQRLPTCVMSYLELRDGVIVQVNAPKSGRLWLQISSKECYVECFWDEKIPQEVRLSGEVLEDLI